MTLHDEIATLITDIRLKDPDEAADAIIALVLAHATSAAAVSRADYAFWRSASDGDVHRTSLRAAILAALGEGE